MDDRYYNEEINYLLEQGKEFARRHPQKARMLHLEDIRSRDPNVERLIESVAFLTSRIRKRLDDDFSSVADSLLSLIWPGYINPIPSFSLLEFRPQAGDLNEVAHVPAGAEIDSEPTEEGLRCRFRTCFPTHVLPIQLEDLAIDALGSTTTVVLGFKLAPDTDPAVLKGHKLKLQIVGEFFVTWQIYNLLLGRSGLAPNVAQLELTGLDSEGHQVLQQTLGPAAVTPVGLTKDEALLPQGQTKLWSFSLIRDFFIFPEKFQGFNLDILDELSAHPNLSEFQVTVQINSPWPPNLKMKKDNLRLNTVPIVNLFAWDATPIRLDRLRHEYTVRGDLEHPEYYEVYSVDSVESIEVGTGERKTYRPLYTARSTATTDELDDCFYSLERGQAPWGGWDTFVSFVDGAKEGEFPEEEVVSLSLTCSNARVASTLLPGQIADPVSHIDEVLRPANLSHPTGYVLPNLEANSLWRWLSHASLNYLSIASTEQFRTLLELHEFTGSDANRHKIEGLQSIEMHPSRTLINGVLVSGVEIVLRVKQDNYADLGEIQLLAQVLATFMSSYASINSYVQLKLLVEPTGHEIVIQPHLGESFQL